MNSLRQIGPTESGAISIPERPLITFVVFAYNQEQFIREAIEGALAQTYTPLEIILSDDCSSDKTFEIMREMAAAYRGPHLIVLNRNEKNLGVGAHINVIVEMAKGELIVGAAGDDISCPDRTQTLVDEWLKQGAIPTSIYSDYEVMDEHGTLLENNSKRYGFHGARKEGIADILAFLWEKHPANNIHGATHAWSRRAFLQAGPLNDDVVLEDKAIGFRSLISGAFAYVPRKLVRYRKHTTNLWGLRIQGGSRISRFRRYIQSDQAKTMRWLRVVQNYKKDVNMFISQGVLSKAEGELILRAISRCLFLRRCEVGIFSGCPFKSSVWLMMRLVIGPKPEYKYAQYMVQQLCFRSIDYFGLLPKA